MSSIGTIGRWIYLPQLASGKRRFVANAPLGAGMMAIAGSNATLGARENGLRTLWEHPGVPDVAGGLTIPGNTNSFNWDADPSDASAPMVLFCGTHRIRTYGELSSYPRVVLTVTLSGDGASTAGIILIGRKAPGRPAYGDLIATATTASGTPTTQTLTLTPTATTIGTRDLAPETGVVTPPPSRPPPVETGRDNVLTFYVGIWNSSGGKSQASALTLYLAEPL